MTALTGYITDYYTSLTALVIAELFIATLGSFATLTWIGMVTHDAKFFNVYQETIDMEISDCEVMQKALKRLYDFETKQLA